MDDTLTLEQKVLVRASELIAVGENWIQGSYFVGENKENYCAVGAIIKASEEVIPRGSFGPHTTDKRDTIRQAVERMVYNHVPYEEYHCIEEFNDDADTTYDDVKDVFCKAVKAALGDKAGPNEQAREPLRTV